MSMESKHDTHQKVGARFWSDIAEDYERDQYRAVSGYPSLWVRHRYNLDMFDADGKNVLDIGCGPGEMLVELLDRGCTVSGTDISGAMIELARKNTSQHPHVNRLDLRVGDIEAMSYPSATFDGVICAGVIEYVEDDTRALAELNRVLKPGGTLIISVRNKACPARAIDLLGDPVKNSRRGAALLSSVKRAITGNPNTTILYTPYRKHFPWRFHRSLRHAGFEKVDFRYYHFYPFFVPFDKVMPRIFVRAGLAMERLSRTRLGWLASGYIVKARKTGEPSY
jgi:ubiquinone/menaquinone biosynthesis C-methylase UbiE